jgi:cytoskeletal protein RodZ
MKKLALTLALLAAAHAAAQGPESPLSEGMALVHQGDFEGAVLKLDEATRALAADPTQSRALADAYLFLGISYVELNQELNARAKFREVLKKEPQRLLSDRVYSQQVIRVFEAARQELYPKKKKRFLPLLLIAGGGTAAAGTAVVAASGGGESPTTTLPPTTSSTTGGGNEPRTPTPTPTTVNTDPGNPTATPTPTTVPGATATPTPVGPTSTPTVTPTGPTATPTATPVGPTATPTVTPVGPTATPTATPVGPTATPTATPIPPTATPTRTPTPACTYTLAPPTAQFNLLGGPGSCNVSTQAGCAWTASDDASWITINGPNSGNGSGTVNYTVAALTLGVRTGRITVSQAPGQECVVVQGLLRPEEAAPGQAAPGESWWESTLDVEGGRGQVVVDGQSVRYLEQGVQQGTLPAGPGPRQVVAQLVGARGRAGTWTFRLPGAVAGSLRPLAGNVLEIAPDRVTFSLAGRPGERLVFTFESGR